MQKRERELGRYRVHNGLTATPFRGYGGRIEKFDLEHEAATEYARSKLPAEFVSLVDFADGTWAAPLPADTPREVVNDFTAEVLPESPMSEWHPLDEYRLGLSEAEAERIAASYGCEPSDLVAAPQRTLIVLAAKWVLDHLAESPAAVALIQNRKFRQLHDVVSWDTPMGLFCTVADASLGWEAVVDLIDGASDVNVMVIVLTSSDRLDGQASLTLDEDDFADLVSRADAVLLNAYDDDGYVRWDRARHCPTSAST